VNFPDSEFSRLLALRRPLAFTAGRLLKLLKRGQLAAFEDLFGTGGGMARAMTPVQPV
jgi:hypothetical protein